MSIKQFQPSVRYVSDLTIFFRDKHTIIVKQGSTMVVFHRWWERHLNDYKDAWKPFCRALRCNANLDLSECRRLANKYDISAQSYSGGLSMPDDIRVISGSKKVATRY